MPVQQRWLVLADFEWCPSISVVVVFRAGEIRAGLTRACLRAAGGRVKKIGV